MEARHQRRCAADFTTGQKVTYNGKAAVIVRRCGSAWEIKIVATGAKVCVSLEEITC